MAATPPTSRTRTDLTDCPDCADPRATMTAADGITVTWSCVACGALVAELIEGPEP